MHAHKRARFCGENSSAHTLGNKRNLPGSPDVRGDVAASPEDGNVTANVTRSNVRCCDVSG